MTAHPKQKVTKARAGMRQAHNALKKQNLSECQHCGELTLPHRMCPSCGTYKGKPVLEVAD